MTAIFLYGTLLDPVLLNLIAGRGDHHVKAATLHDHRVMAQVDTHLPVLVAAPGQTARGSLLSGLSATQIARLDAYELPFGYSLRPVNVMTEAAITEALAYFPPSDLHHSDQPWDIAEWELAHGPHARIAAAEIAAHDPPLSGDALARQWPMIQKRAAASVRAASEPQPSNVRRSAAPGDVVMQRPPRLSGDFFRLASYHLTHETFAGGSSSTLPREVFHGTDAALVLPYDPATDRVLLVEQFRMGPWARGGGNPWALEPIAGMIDAGETPETAALREAEEEAGLSGLALEKMFGIYASPGGSTDHFYCYAGLCSLPDPTRYTGGLATEHEDLRLHVLPFADAFALIASGEANTGPLVAMLLWLDRERARLMTGPA